MHIIQCNKCKKQVSPKQAKEGYWRVLSHHFFDGEMKFGPWDICETCWKELAEIGGLEPE